MTCPDWHQPHCGVSSAVQAVRTASISGPSMPSIVVTSDPATIDSGVTQDRSGDPFSITVQAPHCAMPQPNLVPVS